MTDALALVAWLRQQLDEDHRAIVVHLDDEDFDMAGDIEATRETHYPCSPLLRISKKRALDDVAAKRKLIEQYEAMQLGVDAAEGTVLAGAARIRLGAYAKALQFAAEPYSDRPGYQESWRP